MKLKIDDIVTVTSDETMFLDQQGKIIEIIDDGDEDGPIGVKFGKASDYLFGAFREGENVVRFLETELRKDDDWSIANKAAEKFGDNWHTLYEEPFPFSKENPCMSNEHKADIPRASKRILINHWGSVYPVDVCSEHEIMDGMCFDSWDFVVRDVPELVAA